MEAKIFRNPDNGIETLGHFFFFANNNAVLFKCETLELPYKDNRHGISCYPCGKYICKKVGPTEKIPYPHISITNVPNRDGICMHAANYVSQLRGCTATGDGLADINKDGQLDLINSKKTFEKLMSIVPDTFNLTVSQTL